MGLWSGARTKRAQACNAPLPIAQAEALQQLSPCDVAALNKCLKENGGDHKKARGGRAPPLPAAAPGRLRSHFPAALSLPQCLAEVAAFQQACSKGKGAAPNTQQQQQQQQRQP